MLAATLSCAYTRMTWPQLHLCALKAALTESSTVMKTYAATVIINKRGGNSGNEESPLTLAVFQFLAETAFKPV